MLKLAESSGTVIYESENKLYISKKPAQWTSTFLFITGLLAFISFANYALRFFVSDRSYMSPTMNIVFLALGFLFVLISWRVIVYRKKINTRSFNELKCICIIDLNNNTLLDEQQNILAPLNQVVLRNKMQFASSAPEIVLQWNTGTLSVVKGNPFAGGVSAVAKALTVKGIRRK